MKNALKYFGGGLVAILVLMIIWGLIEPRLLDIEHEDVAIANLPKSWDGRRVAQISDWQIGMWMDNPDTAEDAVEAVIAGGPSLVILTGDFVYHPREDDEIAEDMRAVAQIVRPLVDQGIPTYAVLGNHDYGLAKPEHVADIELAEKVSSTLTNAGVEVLVNEAVPLRPPAGTALPADGGPLYLVGVGSHYAKNDLVAQALADVPEDAPRIVMMHHPDSFELFPANTAPLAVAGHTHGGQIRLPALPSFSYQTFAKSDEVHVDGWIDDYGEPGNQLYVNRGIGMSLLPIRINCMPELTLFTLRRAEPELEPMARE